MPDVSGPEAAEEGGPATPPSRVSVWLRRLLVVGIGASGLALVLTALFVGWRLHDWIDARDDSPVEVVVNRPITVVEAPAAGGTVPNVLGLEIDIARQVMLDADIAPETVHTAGRPYAGESGLVVSQDPGPGAPVGDAVLLTLSTPARMPKLVGGEYDSARNSLAALGASFSVTTRYERGAKEGTVLSTDPPADRPLRRRVDLVVAEPPSSVFLTQLRAIDFDCDTDSPTLKGRQFKQAIVCAPAAGYPEVLEYVLNRRVASFEATIGLVDRSATDAPVTFRAIVDGRPAAAKTLSFGQTATISVPVGGALRLRLETSVPDKTESTSVQAAWAGPRFIGGRPAIDALIAESQS